MSGMTISRVGINPKKIMNQIEEQILIAVSEYGIFADSSLILLKPSTGETQLYRVDYSCDPRASNSMNVEVIPIKETKMRGDKIGLSIAKCFGKLPKDNEWVGMIHLTT